MLPVISAVICTHNRAGYLQKAIQSLCDQALAKEDYEIIIIDNASTDETRKVVSEFTAISNLTYIHEPVLGLSKARNTGLTHARGKYVAFMDDDALAASDWLEKILAAFQSAPGRVGCVGGKIDLLWEDPQPRWLSDEMCSCLGRLDIGGAVILNGGKYFLHGVNIAFPKSIFNSVAQFDVSLGRKGTTLLSGEEVSVQKELIEKGYLCLYDPKICIQHRVPAERLSQDWFLKRMTWEGVSLSRIEDSDLSKFKKRIKAVWEMSKLILSLRILSFFIPARNSFLFGQKCLATKKINYLLCLLDSPRERLYA